MAHSKQKSKPLKISEWYQIMEKVLGHYPGLVAFEQACIQSKELKVCVECLTSEGLVLQTDRTLIKCTDYYMCENCLDYYEKKNA